MNLRTMTDDAALLAACEALDACYADQPIPDCDPDCDAEEDALEADELDALNRAYDRDRR
jgi:hypothetical protein